MHRIAVIEPARVLARAAVQNLARPAVASIDEVVTAASAEIVMTAPAAKQVRDIAAAYEISERRAQDILESGQEFGALRGGTQGDPDVNASRRPVKGDAIVLSSAPGNDVGTSHSLDHVPPSEATDDVAPRHPAR